MSCISVNITTKATGKVTFTAPTPNVVLALEAKPTTAAIGTNVINTRPKVTVTPKDGIHLNIFLVCTTSKDAFLFVKPSEALWITVDKSIHYDVRSNTQWNIH